MKIVFLDFDGVLNSVAWCKKRHEPWREDLLPWIADAEHDLDRDAIERLNMIVRAHPDARVVVSSSWRKLYSLTRLDRMLRHQGFEGQVIGATPDLSHRSVEEFPKHRRAGSGAVQRGDEILAWLDMMAGSEPESFVVLDDGTDMDSVLERFVRTSWEVGLTLDDVQRCIDILNQPLRVAGYAAAR